MAAVLPKWQPRVTEPLFLAADWVQPLVSPIYAGIAQPAMFGIKYAASLMQVSYTKLMYLILSLGVKSNDENLVQLTPTQNCMMDMGRMTMSYHDALVESFPETIEWFLDMKEGRGSEGEMSTCAKTKHENLILSGSLKMFFFASESCNVRYSNDALVRCSMEDGIAGHRHCTGFTIPDATFNMNFLCAADDGIMQLYKTMLWSNRLMANWVEGMVVEIITCINTPDNCHWEDYVDMTSAKARKGGKPPPLEIPIFLETQSSYMGMYVDKLPHL